MKKATFIVAGLMCMNTIFAQSTQNLDIKVVKCAHFGISRPLSDLFETESNDDADNPKMESEDREHRVAQSFLYTVEKDGPEYGTDPSSIQTKMGTASGKAPLTNWAGQTGGGYPPDPSGAAGPTNYVQAVNATPFKIFNKSTGAIVGTVKNIGALWSPATANDGDPVVMYDRYADRWFLSQFGQVGSSNYIYIAISTTNNPAGTYYTYTFTSASFPDYLKFSIWNNGYYMNSNQGGVVYCFERDQMLLGNPSARQISANFTTGPTSGFYCPLPADADGGLPPSTTTALPFFAYNDNAWGAGVDGIKVWNMTVNWGATPSASISAPVSIPTAAFDASYNSSWNDIAQPGTTQKLDGIGGVCTYRAQWRKWTGYNTVLLNWGVKISATQRSIKWVELRQDQTTGVWSLYQEGVYSPDTYYRWVGSMAMDDNGSIALCYAKSGSATVYPSLAYTGRLASDPLGQMTFAETVAIAGSGAQTGVNRFGDYSQTSLDPDGLTFWHTGEYMGGSTGSNALRTRIYSFRLPMTATSINENEIPVQLVAYESGSQLMVKASNLSSDEKTLVDLFDITGRQIASQTVMPSGASIETSFDISGLSQGTYIVRIGRTNTSFQKVIKVVISK